MKLGIFSLCLALIVLALGALFPWSRTLGVLGVCYGLASLGVAIPARSGQVSFGHAMFACVSAYATVFVARAYPNLDGIVLILIATFASAAFGALIGLFIVRYRGIFFGMLNLAVSMVLYSLLGKLYTYTNGSDGLQLERPSFFGFKLERSEFELSLLVFALVLAFVCGWFYQRFTRSGTGQALMGLKTNETRLEYLGLSAHKILWVGYIISAIFVGFSGAVFALAQGLVTPEVGSWMRSGEYVFITILGGVGNALGPFLGAAIFEAVKLFASAYMAGVWQLLLGATLLLVIVVAPEGITGAILKMYFNKRSGGNK